MYQEDHQTRTRRVTQFTGWKLQLTTACSHTIYKARKMQFPYNDSDIDVYNNLYMYDKLQHVQHSFFRDFNLKQNKSSTPIHQEQYEVDPCISDIRWVYFHFSCWWLRPLQTLSQKKNSSFSHITDNQVCQCQHIHCCSLQLQSQLLTSALLQVLGAKEKLLDWWLED